MTVMLAATPTLPAVLAPVRDEYACAGWACTDCMILIANGDVPADLAEGELAAWLAAVEERNAGYRVTPGLGSEEHADGCPVRDGNRDIECDCETDAFSWSACDVCGSNLGGERHGVSFWRIVAG